MIVGIVLDLILQFCTSTFLAGGSCHAAGLAEPGALALSPLSTLANYLPGGILEAVSGFKASSRSRVSS